MTDIAPLYLDSVRYRFRSLKETGDRALAQLRASDYHWSPDSGSNSIGVTIQHLHGNLLSRWTDFLTSDGDKPWRDRDGEFEPDSSLQPQQLVAKWEEGWQCALAALDALQPEDLTRSITIRGQSLGVIDAIQRNLSHTAYHVGQIVWIARHRRGEAWQSLSIPKGQSKQYRPDPSRKD